MFFTVTKCCTDNFARFFIDNYLIFESMSLLFSRIKMFLSVVAIFDSFFILDPFFLAALSDSQ